MDNNTNIKVVAFQSDDINQLTDNVNLSIQKNKVVDIMDTTFNVSADGQYGFSYTYDPKKATKGKSDMRVKFFKSDSLVNSVGFLNRFIKDNGVTKDYVVAVSTDIFNSEESVASLTYKKR